jgi:hypothetical protein
MAAEEGGEPDISNQLAQEAVIVFTIEMYRSSLDPILLLLKFSSSDPQE